jgi:Asp-tRNA(Asn)/Glu-tRNA(Gln) amidotransferase B subunit
MTTQWEAVMGLEIHTQLSTHSKIFSAPLPLMVLSQYTSQFC